MITQTKEQLLAELGKLDQDDIIAILEAARIGLTSSEIMGFIGDNMDLTDEELESLGKKLDPVLR